MAMALVTASALGTVGTVLLWTVAVILGLLLALALLVVLLPFHARAVGTVEGLSARGEARISFGWVLLSVRLRPGGASLYVLGLRLWTFRPSAEEAGEEDEEAQAAKEAEKRAKAEEKKKKRGKKKRPSIRALWRHRRTGWRLLRRLAATLRLRAEVRGVVGLGDPADTASLFQTLWILDGTLPGVRLDVTPDWLDERIELEGELRARLWLAHLGGVLLAALWKKDTRMLLRAVRAGGA